MHQSVASTVLYSGGSPASGKRLGSMPRSTKRAKVRRMRAADLGPAGGQRQPGQRDHGVAAPVAEPVVAGDHRQSARDRRPAGDAPRTGRPPARAARSTRARGAGRQPRLAPREQELGLVRAPARPGRPPRPGPARGSVESTTVSASAARSVASNVPAWRWSSWASRPRSRSRRQARSRDTRRARARPRRPAPGSTPAARRRTPPRAARPSPPPPPSCQPSAARGGVVVAIVHQRAHREAPAAPAARSTR